MYKEIKKALDSRFIETEKVARILSLAIDGEKNCILHGPAGHGKSEMTEHVLTSLGHKEDTYIYSFGEGMSEDLLWGGIDYKTLAQNDELKFNPEESFLNYKYAIFEEIFDAPPIVLLALKDALTAKKLRKGSQQFPMKTKAIIGLTNKEPGEISQMGPAAHALTERFPLQLQVKWDKYNFKMFRKLFAKVYPNTDEHIRSTLANMINESHKNGHFISPRTAIHALQTIILNQEQGVEAFKCLEFIPGLENAAENIEQELKEQAERDQAHSLIQKLENEVEDLVQQFNDAKTNNQCLQIMKQANELDVKAQDMTLPDEIHKMRNEFRNKIQEIINTASDKALKLTKTPRTHKVHTEKDTTEDTQDEN